MNLGLCHPCVKPTKQMATYVATPDDFDAPFDALHNAVLPFQHSSLYIAAPNTSTTINTSTVKVTKKSTEPAPARIPRAPTALTPEHESAVISHYLVLADQERLQRSNASVNNGSSTLNEHESTEMGRSHSILKAPDEIHHNASTKLQHNISHRIPFSPITPRKRNLPFDSNKEPTKKQRVRSDRNSDSITNSINNQVAKSNTFKTSDILTDEFHHNKRGIVGTAMERALQRMPPFHNPTDTSEDIVETVNSEILFPSNSPFPFSLDDDGSNLHSDDGNDTSTKRAFERVLTHHQAPIFGRKGAISVMEIDIDDHHKKRKISSECIPKWTSEEATLPLRTNLTTLPTTSAELYATFFRTPPEHVTPFFNHHIKAVIRNGTLVLPGTPPGTNSRRPPGTLASAHTDENVLASQFLRYNRFWRESPRPNLRDFKVLTETQRVPIQDQVKDLHAAIKSLSHTRKRLLTHIRQRASEEQLWTKCQRKQTLTIASDGGLKGNRATFGWLLRTQSKNILAEGSGPVHGPFDTWILTTCELRG
jgi:hypothetical protein